MARYREGATGASYVGKSRVLSVALGGMVLEGDVGCCVASARCLTKRMLASFDWPYAATGLYLRSLMNPQRAARGPPAVPAQMRAVRSSPLREPRPAVASVNPVRIPVHDGADVASQRPSRLLRGACVHHAYWSVGTASHVLALLSASLERRTPSSYEKNAALLLTETMEEGCDALSSGSSSCARY